MTVNADKRLENAATRVAEQLWSTESGKIVFAESCTAGLVAASLARVPGISAHLAGSFVTYRESAKVAWLGVRQQSLDEESAVSQTVTDQMAGGALARLDEAYWSCAVTGHLGPDSPDGLDGVVFISVARRNSVGQGSIITRKRIQLSSGSRVSRQREAAAAVLEQLRESLQGHDTE